MDSVGDPSKLPAGLVPASIAARVVAGTIDLFAIAAMSATFFVAPLAIRGLVLPMLAVFIAVIAWSVVPLALFGATLGMRLCGIELAGIDGQRADVGEVLFRELVGRGMIAASYLGTILVGIVGMFLGMAAFHLPVGLGFLLFALASMALAIAAAGHLLVLGREDRRGLADLVSKTIVVVRRQAVVPEDEDERAWFLQQRRGRIRNLAIAQVVAVGAAVGVPVLLGSPAPLQSGRSTVQRFERQEAEARFAANPHSEEAARALASVLERAGEDEEAHHVIDRHREAVAERAVLREAALRRRVAAGDEDARSDLLELLEEAGRLEEAKEVYRGWVAATPTPGRHGSFGIWLYQNEFGAEAITELTTATAAPAEPGDEPDGELLAYLGFALEEAGRKDEAKVAFKKALAADPDLYQVAEKLRELDAAR